VFAFFNERILRKSFILIFGFISIYNVHYIMGLIFLAWFGTFIFLNIYFAVNINNYSTIYGKNKATISGTIVDSINNIFNVNIFNCKKYEQSYLRRFLKKTRTSEENTQWFMFKLRYVLGIISTLMSTYMLYNIIILKINKEITTGGAVLVFTLVTSVFIELVDLTQEIGDLFEEIGLFNQSIDLLDKEHQCKEVKNTTNLKISEGKIEFRDVSFKYNKNSVIFNKQSILLPAKNKIGLTGFSGSGKTTFIKLILKIIEPYIGNIFIDNQNIKNIRTSSIYDNISLIPQEPILFHRSILDNIKYGNKNASFEDIIRCTKMANIHDVIMNMPKQYHTICGERGNSLSGGQRQSIIIARAMLKNSPIIILDEATSSLDNISEKLIQDSLKKLTKNKTVIIIAHKLKTLQELDKIIVFDKGKITGHGHHKDLIETNEIYKKLWHIENS
ncbi:MAG TPA: ABC transporter ATP-binding protein, partial [Candidatus Megaira endosymbiont of Hartmannula sinica]|nr:ABC transporter ATP-binding protein [Candidatus Megaera endosymbiont of Hartmannula sinica]